LGRAFPTFSEFCREKREIILDGPEKDLYTVKSTVEGLLGNTMKLACPMPVEAFVVDNYGEKE